MGHNGLHDRKPRSKRTITCRASKRLVLRVAGPADLESLSAFEVRCFPEHPFRQDHIAWIVGNDHALTLVQDAAHGFAAVMMLLFEGRTCRVLSIGVSPEDRRRGIATRMMQAAEAISRERGMTTIRLEVSTRNFGAIELYRALGYRTDGVLYGYYSWGEDAYSMGKSVSERLPPRTAPEPRSMLHTAK
jgi:ribosomal-protein-alanine N-acetyltransferase